MFKVTEYTIKNYLEDVSKCEYVEDYLRKSKIFPIAGENPAVLGSALYLMTVFREVITTYTTPLESRYFRGEINKKTLVSLNKKERTHNPNYTTLMDKLQEVKVLDSMALGILGSREVKDVNLTLLSKSINYTTTQLEGLLGGELENKRDILQKQVEFVDQVLARQTSDILTTIQEKNNVKGVILGLEKELNTKLQKYSDNSLQVSQEVVKIKAEVTEILNGFLSDPDIFERPVTDQLSEIRIFLKEQLDSFLSIQGKKQRQIHTELIQISTSLRNITEASQETQDFQNRLLQASKILADISQDIVEMAQAGQAQEKEVDTHFKLLAKEVENIANQTERTLTLSKRKILDINSVMHKLEDVEGKLHTIDNINTLQMEEKLPYV